ncbi:hypothetical protein F7018_15765 [Tenacibaculum aiptasiae]|uniref:Uncharacterized protein n=1 Tax=Tenacibaculum aiptasiae TaxID=426481 RepID=A0A7J5A8P5_9FLAO|nr:hypothetical protein [Tenacibaculum aiptasiae]KAB1153942.1 hypothetical protein F7018_15765 [Tenacibaculum aiptasiae]
MKAILILISFFFFANSSVSHQDTILKVDKKGNIIGLPNKFNHSKFDLEKGYLKINNKEVIFPNCIKHYFDILEKPKFTLLASWYHSKDIMPFYLNFDLSQENKDYGYNILINLETLELISINISLKQENTYYTHEIKLDKNCLDDYKKELKKLKQ